MLNTECVVRHQSLAEYPKNLQWFRVWDLAHTAKERAKQDPDYTSGTLLAFNIQDNMMHLWIKDIVRMRENAPKRDTMIRTIAKLDGPVHENRRRRLCGRQGRDSDHEGDPEVKAHGVLRAGAKG
jgi:phage terminase large subunit-like protein